MIRVKMYLRETGYVDVDCITLAEDRVQWWAFVKTAMNIQVP
jgi:hypothetical protein